jgi:hypothetical protein
MSYDILIGNAELEAEWASDDGPVARWTVKLTWTEGAPAFPFDFQPGANVRSPGYSQWADFCRATGLHALFYGGPDDGRRHYGGILSEHPGIVPLTPLMLATVVDARERWEQAHPGAVPGFDFAPGWMLNVADDGVRGRDPILARLLWLEWWMAHALRTCERPAVYNR